jgi:RHS repeat-associated protein
MLEGTHESVYEYDGASRRVRIKELESSVETKNETFVWCGSRICQKRNSGGVVRSYFREGFEAGSSDYFYTRDHLASVREVVSSDGTTISGRVSYDPWGKATETGSVLPDFGFTGHYFDRSTGLGLTWYRGYDPNLGRWLSRDPIGLKGGLNLYAYVGNEPITRTDPDGLFPTIPVHPNMCKVQCRLSLFAELERCPPIEFPPPSDEYSCPPRPGDDPWGFQPPCESIANSHYEMCMDSCEGNDPIRPIPNDDHTHGRPQYAGN